jgi:hypothetical protein
MSYDEYIKNGKINVINLGIEAPKAKRNNFFDIEANNGQVTSRHGKQRKIEDIEVTQSNHLLTIGDYENE